MDIHIDYIDPKPSPGNGTVPDINVNPEYDPKPVPIKPTPSPTPKPTPSNITKPTDSTIKPKLTPASQQYTSATAESDVYSSTPYPLNWFEQLYPFIFIANYLSTFGWLLGSISTYFGNLFIFWNLGWDLVI